MNWLCRRYQLNRCQAPSGSSRKAALGFTLAPSRGDAKAGDGLFADCVVAILRGTPQRRRASKPLPQVDPRLVPHYTPHTPPSAPPPPPPPHPPHPPPPPSAPP